MQKNRLDKKKRDKKNPNEMSHPEYREWRDIPIKDPTQRFKKKNDSSEYILKKNPSSLKNESSPSTIEVFDALPHHIQKNHALLEAFCYWYLRKVRRLDQRTKRQVQKKAKELTKKHPDMKSGDMSKHPEILEAGAKHFSNLQVRRWLREVLQKRPGRPRKN